MQETWHVMIVEGDVALQKALGDQLRTAGFEVAKVYDGQSALDQIGREGLPHLVLIEMRLPDPEMNGLDLARELYERNVPVIMMTAAHSPEVALESLRYADDYVRKPFDTAEVIARVRRVLSRIADFSYATRPVLQIDDRLGFDYRNNRLLVEGQAVSLTPIESRLLNTLMQHQGQVVDSRALIARVWSSGDIYEDTLRVHVHRLRSKLEIDARKPQYILTERGVGYSFNVG